MVSADIIPAYPHECIRLKLCKLLIKGRRIDRLSFGLGADAQQ